MRLEGISAEIRPRNPWEAIDLGCVLTRRHFSDILRAWCVTVVPLWLVILAAMHQHPIWAVGVIWWLKPVTERVPLFVLSRALFGEPLRWRELWREWPRMIGRRVWDTLFWRRLSPARSLEAPVVDLEGLRGTSLSGAEFRRRRKAVALGAGSAAFWMQSIVLLVLHSSWTGLLLFAYFMIPIRYRPDLRVLSDEWGDPGALGPLVATWVGIGLYLVFLSLVTPFFVGGGFGLYLNSRTQQEGWDVELAFRRMGNRLSRTGTAMLLAVSLGLLTCWPHALRAQEPATGPGQEAKKAIVRVLENPDFEIHKAKIYRVKDRKQEKLPSFELPQIPLPFLSGFGNLLTWVILVSLGAFVIYWLVRALVTGRAGARGLAAPKRAPVKTVMGLNVEEEKLPPALVSAARSLWNRGDWEGATRLLYRGAVSWLIHRGGVSIQESDTEVDCLQRVQAEQRPEATYFGELTQVWVLAAYGKRKGSEEVMTGLFARWPFTPGAKGGES